MLNKSYRNTVEVTLLLYKIKRYGSHIICFMISTVALSASIYTLKAWLKKQNTCQEDVMVGTAPLFSASRKDCVTPASTGPVMIVPATCLGLVLSKINLVNSSSPA